MSTVVSTNIQIGQSANTQQNFVVYQPATPDGSVRVKNQQSNVDVLTISSNQTLIIPGVIESTAGGVKFPDGSTQTTAAIAGISTGKSIAMAMIFGG
jgi:hypothetical protein